MELYVHIPFCIKKCEYCDFLSGPAGKEIQEAYVHALIGEIQTVGKESRREITSVFIGGGTPSTLTPDLMAELLEQLEQNFCLVSDVEYTIEANPGTLSREKLKVYRGGRINRLSLGVQSADDEELKMLGRIHTWQEFLDSFAMAREAGFTNINVDLMSAIPGQTYEKWVQNLRRTAALEPEHISAYSLIVEEGTPFAKKQLVLPDEDTEYRMYEDTAAVLGEYGYRQYEISNYAKEGFACRHNIGYWKRREYLGLGLGAASLYQGRRFSNTGNMQEYLQKSKNPEKIRREVMVLSREEEMEEFMFLGLRMTEGVSRDVFLQTFGCTMESIYGAVLKKYLGLSMLQEKEGQIFLSRRGIHVSNVVLADFLL